MTQTKEFSGAWGLAQGLGLGGVAGILSGLFGIGGGAVLVPLLVMFGHMAQHPAHATSLAAIVLTALSATVAFAAEDAVAFGPGVVVAAGAMVGAWVGAGVMHRLSAVQLRRGFAALLIVTAVQLLLGLGVSEGSGGQPLLGPVTVVGFVVLGLVAGVLSAVLGVGGGVIMVPALVLLAGLSQHAAEGTSLLVIVPTSIMGALRHARHGYTDWRLGLLLGVGGIVGAQAGAYVALQWLNAVRLSQLFGVFLLLTAVQLLASSRQRQRPAASA